MKKVIKEEEESEKYLKEISKSIFDIGSLNHFWSNLYAKLYKFLIIDYSFMKSICIDNFNKYLIKFNVESLTQTIMRNYVNIIKQMRIEKVLVVFL